MIAKTMPPTMATRLRAEPAQRVAAPAADPLVDPGGNRRAANHAFSHDHLLPLSLWERGGVRKSPLSRARERGSGGEGQ